jgi:ArsR family metal-binding transcriptional regulator
MIASAAPGTLRELYRLDPDFPFKLALIVGSEKEFSGLRHCPYTTVEMADALATHERILEIHNSGKAVFVRASFGKRERAANEEAGKIEKRVRWLMHEGADAILSDRVDLLSSIIGLSERTRPNNGMHPTPLHGVSHDR